jgi:hypothetical protein
MLSFDLVYLIGLAVFNVAKINAEFIFPLVELIAPHVLDNIVCNIRYTFKFTFGEMCSWSLIIISVERVILLKNKKIKSNKKSFKKSLAIYLSFFIAFLAFNSIMLVYYSMVKSYNPLLRVNKCNHKFQGLGNDLIKDNYLNYSYMVGSYTILFSIIPFFVLIVTNLMIIFTIKRIKKSKISERKLKEARENAKILLFLTFMFLIFSLPSQLSNFVFITFTDKETNKIFNFFYYIFIILESTNNCFNAFIIIIINKNLRKNFFILIKNRRKYISWSLNFKISLVTS